MADLSDYTSFHVGGPAKELVNASTEAEIIKAVQDADSRGVPLLILGGGTNVLVSDEGFDGVVIHVSSAHVEAEVDACSGATLTIGAGQSWDAFVAITISRGYAGLETLSGIPGTVGSAPIQNIGAYGHEVSEFITRVRTYDRTDKRIKTFTNAECEFEYRSSLFKKELGRFVILDVGFQLRRGEVSRPIVYEELAQALKVKVGEKASIFATREATLKLRAEKGMLINPADHDSWSAGSFFTNPLLTSAEAKKLPENAPRWLQDDGSVKVSAAWLMEQAGLRKGHEHAGARISTKHVLALTNTGRASAADIAGLAKEAQEKVMEMFQIRLEPEVNLIGLTLN